MIDSGGARSMRRWWAGVAACSVAVPLLLAGCAEKHQASESLPPTSKTTTSNTLPPLGPADFPVPAEARQKTPDGVIAFTRYYVDLLNHQAETLLSQPLRDFSRNCQTCTELADGYDNHRAAGYHFEGGDISVTGHGNVVLKDDTAEMSLVFLQAAVTVRDASGRFVANESSDAYSLTGGIALAWDKARSTWIVTKLDADRL